MRLVSGLGLLLATPLVPVLAVVALGINLPPRVETPGEGEILLAEARRQQALWIDTRSLEQHQAGSVPGALPLNEDDWDDLVPAILEAWDGEQPVVIYAGGPRSQPIAERVARRLRDDTGWERIHVLKGGYDAWRFAKH